MKNMVWKTLSLLMTLLLVMGCISSAGFCAADAADSTSLSTGDVIAYGSYPQDKVKDSDLLTALNALSLSWQSYGYSSGAGSAGTAKVGDYMQYADVVYDDDMYRAVRFSQYRPSKTSDSATEDQSEQDDNGYSINTVYWFKYEPLIWRVLDPAKGLLMCASTIDAQPYSDYSSFPSAGLFYNRSGEIVNDYCTSSVRSWLNGSFLNTAFTDAEASQLVSVSQGNTGRSFFYNKHTSSANTSDPVFLLSYDQVINSSYGFSGADAESKTRYSDATDYTYCQGVANTGMWHTVLWTLRTPYDLSQGGGVSYKGKPGTGPDADVIEGIRPAVFLSAQALSAAAKVRADAQIPDTLWTGGGVAVTSGDIDIVTGASVTPDYIRMLVSQTVNTPAVFLRGYIKNGVLVAEVCLKKASGLTSFDYTVKYDSTKLKLDRFTRVFPALAAGNYNSIDGVVNDTVSGEFRYLGYFDNELDPLTFGRAAYYTDTDCQCMQRLFFDISDTAAGDASLSVTVNSSSGVKGLAGTSLPLTLPAVTWSSSNEAVASVDASGKVTGVSAGTAVLTVSTGLKYYTVNVTVGDAAAPVFAADITGTDTYKPGAAASPIDGTAGVSDGGVLTYQWYSNSTASTDGAQAIAGAVKASFTPPTDKAGDTYYYVVATDTNGGSVTSARSGYREVIVASGAGLKELTYSFANCNRDFGYAMNYRLPYAAYKYIFGDTMYAEFLYNAEGTWGGNCFGMSSTSLLFNNSSSGMAAADFNSTAAYPLGLKVTDTNTGMSMSLRQFIEYMQVSQFDQSIQDIKQAHLNDLGGLCTAVRSYELTGSEPVIVSIHGPGGGHAIVGYKLARISADTTYLYVYDCNFPDTTRYITLKTDSAGNYVSWYYKVNDIEDWGTDFSGSWITYSRYSDIINVWNSRKGKMDDNRYLLGMKTLNAKIMDGSGKVVAELVNGELRTDNKDIYLMQSTALTSDNTQGGSTTPLIWLPSDKYTVVSTDEDPKLDISVLGSDRQVDVSAGAGQVTIDAAAGAGTAEIAGAEGQAVSIKVSSSVKDYVQISGSAASGIVSAAVSGSSVSASGIKDTEVSVNGKSAQTYTVAYDANGGSGAPAQQIKAGGSTLVLASGKPVRDGYTFLGWAAKNDAKTAEYQPGGEYKTDASVTLFAVWQKNEVPTAKTETTTQKPGTTAGGTDTTHAQIVKASGDLDLDGKVTAADARLALRIAVSLDVPTVDLLNAADVDFDGYVTAADARLILRAAVGLEELRKVSV